MRHSVPILILAGFVFAATPSRLARAQDASGLIAFHEGRYGDAASLGEAGSDPSALAFAARALLADAFAAGRQPSEDLLDRAETAARSALALEPAHAEARLQLAIALSLRLRPLPAMEAHRSGWGGESRALAEGVLADDPDNPYAHAFLSVWHLEVVRRGGPIGARMMKASVKEARRNYATAAAGDPGNAAIHWQYARALTALNARKYRDEIGQALAAATAAPCEDALEGLMAGRAASLVAVLAAQTPKDAERIAEDML